MWLELGLGLSWITVRVGLELRVRDTPGLGLRQDYG